MSEKLVAWVFLLGSIAMLTLYVAGGHPFAMTLGILGAAAGFALLVRK